MHIGCQMHAPLGMGSLRSGIRYYYYGRNSSGENVLLVWFQKSAKSWRAYCIWLSTAEFEEAISGVAPQLKTIAVQLIWPEWLSEVEGVSFEEVENDRYQNKKQTIKQQVENRYQNVAQLLDFEHEILNSKNPLKSISLKAKGLGQRQHPYRIQLWFFTYVLHGREIWALKQPTHVVGKWNRSSKDHANKKFGRSSLDDGDQAGWPSDQMAAKIVKSYLTECGLGISMSQIHRNSLSKVFGCRTVKNEAGNLVHYQPNNLPFPSYGQFRYRVVEKLTLPVVQKTLFGAHRVRNRASVDGGNFTQQFCNLLESMEVDAYRVFERPHSMFSDAPMPALVVARGVCVATGAVVGIGFSLDGESADAYRAMLFSMAVDKKIVAQLYGIPAEKLEWAMQGLPSTFASDRGPGGSSRLIQSLEQQFPIKTVQPSYEPKGKASVESSQPRNTKHEGAPSFMLSDLNVVQMMKREVMRAAADNRSSDISSRLSDQSIHDFRQLGYVATPACYWKYLSDRLRTSAHHLSIDQAVRSFCTRIELRVNRTGAVYKNRSYGSEAFTLSGLQTECTGLSNFTITGYSLNMVTRHVWAEVKGRLMMLEALKRVRIDDEDLYVSLSDLENTADTLAILRSQTRKSKQAAQAEIEQSFYEITGKKWHQAKLKAGTPRRAKGLLAQESKVIAGKAQTRKAA